MARILVTGGLGFVGSHLVRKLDAAGDEVRILDITSPAEQPRVAEILQGTGFEFYQADVRDADAVAAAIVGVDRVVHLASHVGIESYLADPAEVADVIVTGSRTVALAAGGAGAPLLFVSTSEVFGRNPEVPWAEDADCVMGDPSRPRWVYAAAKILVEHIFFDLANTRDLQFCTARLFNLYGPGQDCRFFVTRTVWRLANGLPPVVHDGGDQRRCFTWIGDAVDALARIPLEPAARQQVFNIGNDRPLSVRAAVETIARVVGRDLDLLTPVHRKSTEVYGERYDEPLVRIPDVTKARRLVGWAPTTQLADGVRLMLDWVDEHGWWDHERDDGR